MEKYKLHYIIGQLAVKSFMWDDPDLMEYIENGHMVEVEFNTEREMQIYAQAISDLNDYNLIFYESLYVLTDDEYANLMSLYEKYLNSK